MPRFLGAGRGILQLTREKSSLMDCLTLLVGCFMGACGQALTLNRTPCVLIPTRRWWLVKEKDPVSQSVSHRVSHSLAFRLPPFLPSFRGGREGTMLHFPFLRSPFIWRLARRIGWEAAFWPNSIPFVVVLGSSQSHLRFQDRKWVPLPCLALSCLAWLSLAPPPPLMCGWRAPLDLALAPSPPHSRSPSPSHLSRLATYPLPLINKYLGLSYWLSLVLAYQLGGKWLHNLNLVDTSSWQCH